MFSALAIVSLPLIITALVFVVKPRWGAWCYLALIPLFMYQKSMFLTIYIGGKALQWPTLVKDFLGLGILCFILTSKSLVPLIFRTRKHFLLPFGILFAMFIVSGLLNNQSAFALITALRSYFFYLFLGFTLALYLLKVDRDLERFARVFIAGSVLIAAIALIHFLFDRNFLIHSSFKQPWFGGFVNWWTYINRLKSIFTSANVLGFFMSLSLVFVLWFSLKRNMKTKILLILLGPIFFAVLMLTESRTALLGLIAGVSIILIYLVPKRGAIVLTGVVFMLPFLLQLGFYEGRFSSLADNVRLSVWSAHVNTVISSPRLLILGAGPGAIGRSGAEFTESSVNVREVSSFLGSSSERLHFIDNAFIKGFFELGLIGAMYVFWLLHFVLRGFFLLRSQKLERIDRYYLLLPLSIMIFVIVISAFSDSIVTYPWSLLYGLAVGSLLNVRLGE